MFMVYEEHCALWSMWEAYSFLNYDTCYIVGLNLKELFFPFQRLALCLPVDLSKILLRLHGGQDRT